MDLAEWLSRACMKSSRGTLPSSHRASAWTSCRPGTFLSLSPSLPLFLSFFDLHHAVDFPLSAWHVAKKNSQQNT
jgi:hypothetical protein